MEDTIDHTGAGGASCAGMGGMAWWQTSQHVAPKAAGD